MNERILSPQLLKLVQTAGPGYSLADPVWVKKFAELIVKECIGIIEDISPAYNDYRDAIEEAFRIYCVAKIKQDFGVE